MLGLFVVATSCTSGIYRLDLMSVTDDKSYVTVHQCSAEANPLLSADDPVEALKLLCVLLHCTVHCLTYNRCWNIIGSSS